MYMYMHVLKYIVQCTCACIYMLGHKQNYLNYTVHACKHAHTVKFLANKDINFRQ